MNILVTGALGYIGSHASLELIRQNYNLVLVDNLFNSERKVLSKIEKLTFKKIRFEKLDIRNFSQIKSLLYENKIDAVIHFAGLKSIEESFIESEEYFDVNVNGTSSLIKAMNEVMEKKIFIFSSSACVYGQPKYLPIDENHTLFPMNPYGSNKLEIEQNLIDIHKKERNWNIISLRYFNPVGSEDSFTLGENSKKNSQNLMPHITKVALKKDDYFKVYGKDYETKDGTGVRDYIHIMDLIDGHISALRFLKNKEEYMDFINLGTGKGYSVIEILETFKKVNSIEVPYKFYPRREGDAASSFADNSKAKKFLNWKPKRSLEDMCKSAWEYQKNI
tara:strand:- start:9948 stop:10949 length:1002 start_codon:yes stop_codon:yes gene_type:complete